jgi:hypothetical protein
MLSLCSSEVLLDEKWVIISIWWILKSNQAKAEQELILIKKINKKLKKKNYYKN